MNTKGIKFLAVLAVMVMAFAAIVVLAPADKDTDAVIVYGDKSEVIVDPTVIDDTITKNKFYISDDATVKIKDLSGITGNVEFYVQNGVELELDFKQAAATTSHTPAVNKTIVIYTVTGDQQRVTTSTVDNADKTVSNGKIIINSSKFQFTGADKQNVVYTAMMPMVVSTTATSGPVYTTYVDTWGDYGNYALISVSSELTGTVTVGEYVAVAPGQSIESVEAIDGLNYGIAYFDKKNDDNKEMYTYYAAGANANAIAIESDDKVTIVNGSVIVNNGTASVKATGVKQIAKTSSTDPKPAVIEYGAANQVKVSGGMSSGTMTVSGNVLFVSSFVNKGTVTLNASANVVSDSAMTVTGTLVLKNEASKVANLKVSGTGFIVAENEKLWTYDKDNKPALTFADKSSFTGQYDTTAINKNADVYDAFATAAIEVNQTFRMIGDTVVAGSLTVKGTLIIEPGVTMTISELNQKGASVLVEGQYAQIINNGTIIIKTNTPLSAGADIGLKVTGGSVMNNGIINASSLKGAAVKDTFVIDYDASKPLGYGFVNNGTISVGKYDTAKFDQKFTNNSDGSVTVTGTLKADSLVNKGIFTVNNATITTDDTVTSFVVTMSKGAEFKVVSANIEAGKSMQIKNSGSSVTIATKAATAAPATAEAEPVRITGLNVADTSYKYGSSTHYQLDVSGTIGTNGSASIVTGGNIVVTESFTVSKGYTLDFSTKTNLDVYGTMTVSKDVTLAKTEGNAYELHMCVDGLVTDVDGILSKAKTFKYVAAKYILPNGTTYIYTNLADAITSAVEAKVTNINVGNDTDRKLFITVTEDLAIPEGITVDGNYLEVDDKATIYVESGAMFSFDKIVIQDGMIAADDVNSINYDEILADVKEEDEESTKAVCMSLEVALAIATPGTVIELANTFYAADEDLVIPEGVIVNATVNNGTDFVLVNSNLVVEGTLAVDHFAFIATTDDTIGITVTGYIYDKDTGACFKGWWYTPFGVSYYETDEEDHTWYVITTIENIQPAIDVADNAEVTVEGDAVLDELNVQGRDDMPGTVNFNGNVDIDNIVIDEVTLNFTKGKEINTTVRNAVGSITITGAYADDNLSIFDMAIYSTEEVGVYMEGVVTDGAYATYGILFEGITGMDSTDVRTDIKWTSKEESPAIVFDGVTTVIGKKAYIQYDAETGTPAVGMVTISGTLTAYNNSKLTINSDVQIVGALVAAERTEDANPGSIETTGNIFVGMLASDIYYMDAYPPVHTPATGDVAILSGKVALAAGKNIYAAPAAIVDPEIVDDLDTMGIYIDAELWFTVYGYENDKFTLNGLMVPMLNAEIYSILDENQDRVAAWAGNIIALSKSKTLSGFGNVYITLDYHIFEVKIKTDGSVKAVYIDGILMETGESKNIFIMRNVAAGTHKVTVEAATGYDASKCVLYTEGGTILPNLGFTFTQFDCTETDIDPVTEDEIPVVVYNIKGTEIQPEPVPPTPEEESQWTVTTILLVILVVLIAIMAVIVALRLNRS